MYSFKAYQNNNTIYGDIYSNGTKIGTKEFYNRYMFFKDGEQYVGIDAVIKSLEDEGEKFGFFLNGKTYPASKNKPEGIESYNEEEDITYEKEEVEVGYSDMKIKYNITEPVDKTMSDVFGYDIISQNDYDEYVKNTKPNTSVVNPEKPGLATLFKQAVLTVGDMLGFLFKLIKDAVDQIIKSFILPILAAAAPFTLPLIIKNVVDIIMKIVEMVNEAISMVSDTLNWLLKKVAGKLVDIKIPIPEFKIPLFGLSLTIPPFDQLKLLKVEPFPGLPSIKIDNFTKQIEELEKLKLNIPLTELREKMLNMQKIKDIGAEVDKLKNIKDSDITDLEKELSDVNYEISELNDKNNKESKDFMDSSLDLMKTARDVLRSMLFTSTYDLSKTIIDMHNDVIIKKKEVLDSYLSELIESGKGINIDLTDLETFNQKLREENIILSEYNNGITIDVIRSDDINNINTDINYVIDIQKNIFGLYKAGFIKYNFTDRLEIYQREYNSLDSNKIIVKEYKAGSKTLYKYAYNGDYDYLKIIAGFLVDELEKEELDLEEEINKHGLENIPEYKEKIDTLNELINNSYKKVLKPSEQYRTPKLSKAEKESYIKLGKELPKEDVLVTELVIDGYRKRIVDQEENIYNIIVQIEKIEEGISKFEDVIQKSGVSGNVINPNDVNDPNASKLEELKSKKNEIEKKLNEISPESVRSSKIIQFLLAIIAFPIQIIAMLLSDLFGGIIEFITSLPLLSLDRLISFFSSLFKLPTKDGMSTLVKKTVSKYTEISDDAIRPITSLIDGSVEGVSDITTKYVEKLGVPFDIPEIPGNLSFADSGFFADIPTGTVPPQFTDDELGVSYKDNNGGVEWNKEIDNWEKITPSPGVKIVNSYLLNDFHPQKRQKVFNDIEGLIRYLKTKYKTDVYMHITSVRRSKRKSSAHYYGLAFDNNIFVYNGKGSNGYSAINNLANWKNAQSNPIMLDAERYMTARNWEWGGRYSGVYKYKGGIAYSDPVHFELKPYDSKLSKLDKLPKLYGTDYPNLDLLV